MVRVIADYRDFPEKKRVLVLGLFDAVLALSEGVGLRIYSRPCWANRVACPGPNESRAPAPHSLVGSMRQAVAMIRFCRRRSDLFAYSLQSRADDLLSLDC